MADLAARRAAKAASSDAGFSLSYLFERFLFHFSIFSIVRKNSLPHCMIAYKTKATYNQSTIAMRLMLPAKARSATNP